MKGTWLQATGRLAAMHLAPIIVPVIVVLFAAVLLFGPTEILPSPTPNLTVASTLALTPTPVTTPVAVIFTITCADSQSYTAYASEPITLSAINAVFIEPNVAPKDGDALTGSLLKLPGEEKKFSYAPSGSGLDMVTFTFITNEETGSVATKALPITVVPQRQGLCYP